MPNSTQFMQEMTSKDQNSSVWTKQISLKRDSSREKLNLRLHLASRVACEF